MKNIIFEMLRDYLPTIFTFIMTVLVATLKSKYTKIANDNIKKDVAATTVKYVEQVFKDIHGKDKLDKAVEYMLSLLEEKGITISDNEIVLLLESAVKDMNSTSLTYFINEIKNGGAK